MDLLAWMSAQYIALALNAPERFPQSPRFFPPRTIEMTDDEIKARVMRMAR